MTASELDHTAATRPPGGADRPQLGLARPGSDPEASSAPPRRLPRRHDLTVVELFAVEVRSALATALGSVEVLHDEDALLTPEQRARLLTGARRGLLLIHEVLEDVIDLQRLDPAASPARGDTVELARIVYRVAADVGSDAPLRVTAVPASVRGDEMLLRRAIGNLVRNAIEHAPGGAGIVLDVQPHDEVVRVIVDDDGPGVPQRDRERIFEPFDRGGAVPRSPGLGLGLTLVRRIATLHRGRVWAEASPSGGSRFVLELPVADPDTAPDGVPDATSLVIDIHT